MNLSPVVLSSLAVGAGVLFFSSRELAVSLETAASVKGARQPERTPATEDPVKEADASALTTAAVRTILSSMDGSWNGVLEYADYGSGDRVEIPVALEQEASAIEPVLVRRVAFTDPGRVIESSESVRLDASARTMTTYPLSDGGSGVAPGTPGECWTIETALVLDRDDWTLVMTRAGTDDGRDATLRMTQRMLDGTLTSRKDVDITGDGGVEWVFRNEVRVQRATPDPEALVGEWTVDLRPTPDADPYPVTMRITSVEGGDLAGTFYNGSPIEAGRVNIDWSGVSFAFTTSDGSGTYFTSGTLRNGVVHGLTYAEGREFLAVWEGNAKE
ncbi:MAG: hypothetical protein ACF8Q5_12760 [Phycisphaerales bacterium JB040]